MLRSFFFIPANKKNFIEKIHILKSDFFILDLEESVGFQEKEEAIENIKFIKKKEDHWVRPFLKDSRGQWSFSLINECISLGYTKFVLPKIGNKSEIEFLSTVLSSDKNLQFILLVENPMVLIQLSDILESGFINFTGVALGSHDYSLSMNMEHTLENLSFARNMILNTGKAFGITVIDIVSMNLNDQEAFQNECKQAHSLGFDAKFVLHPVQLEFLKSTKYYTDAEVELSLGLFKKMQEIGFENITVLEHNGKVYEKPHLKRIKEIVNWSNNYGRK